MFGTDKKQRDDKPEALMKTFFRSCALALAGVLALWLALQLLAQFWGWLLLAATLAGLLYAVIWLIRLQRERRW